MVSWTLDDIPWETFDPARVDPELLKLVKAASVVEHNYCTRYLKREHQHLRLTRSQIGDKRCCRRTDRSTNSNPPKTLDVGYIHTS